MPKSNRALNARVLRLCGASLLAIAAVPTAVRAQAAQATDAAQTAPQPQTARSPTVAQGQGGGGIEEIVVTAQKRSENLQKVPIAITAFTVESLDRKGITNIAALGKFTPSVELVGTSPFSGSTNVLSAYIRGIGQNDFAFNLDPGVGVYVDGVYYGRTVGAVVDLLDLDHVEILKGPQGTLFGRNTIGGAISVVTRDPGKEFGGRGEFIYGEYNRIDVNATLDLPLVEDKLYGQISVASKTRDGYHKFLKYPGNYVTDVGQLVRPDGTTYGEAGGENTQNIRAKLKWLVTPDVTFRVTADYTHVNDQPTPSQLITKQAGLNDVYNACINTPAATLAGGPLGTLCNTPRGLPLGAYPTQVLPALGGVNVDGNPYNDHLTFDNRFVPTQRDTSYSTGAGYSKVQTWGVTGVLDAHLTNALAVKSITAYRNLDSRFGEDVDGTPIPIGDHAFVQTQFQVSQELQLLGNFFDNRLKTVTGLYYFHEAGNLTDEVDFAGGLLQIYGPNRFKTDSYAAFTQADYKITDKLGITAGVRYTRDEKYFFGGQRDLNSLAFKLGYPLSLHPDPTDPTLYFPATQNRLKFSNVSFKAGLNYQATDRILTYFTFSQGFKSGGWTTRATTPILAAPTFNPEKANTYEIGVKGQFFDRLLQANIAGYYTDYQDLQVTVYSGVSPITLNAAQSEIKGIEAEFVLVPTHRLTLASTLSYIDAKYTQKDASTQLGNQFINTPEFQASVNVDYDQPLPGGATGVFHLDYSHKSSIARDGENTPELTSIPSDTVGSLLSYRPPSEKWHLDVGVTNLTNERFIVTGQHQAGIGYIAGTYNRPREWYVRAGFKF